VAAVGTEPLNPELGPEDLLDFIELPSFTKRWAELGLNDEADLTELQLQIMDEPKRAPVVRGTNGIRKLRFAPARWNVGKSGAARVLYVYFERFGVALLCLVFRKNEADDISDAVKARLSKLIVEIGSELERRHGER
jgi:hypothetical protein